MKNVFMTATRNFRKNPASFSINVFGLTVGFNILSSYCIVYQA